MTDDPLIAQKEEAETDARRTARAANLFDVRRFIGGLFAIYGVILTILGIGGSDEDIDQAAGINVNLWTGLAMLAVARLVPGVGVHAADGRAARRGRRAARGGPRAQRRRAGGPGATAIARAGATAPGAQ